MISLKLCSIPFLSIDYSNVVDFNSYSQRASFFNSYKRHEVVSNLKSDGERTIFNVNIPAETMIQYDYCFYHDKNNKPFYYFITNVERVTGNNSNIYVKLDVWSTYFFDIQFLPSFVDRCHVNRWNGNIPTVNNNEEGLYKGEIKQISNTKLCDLNKSIVITSSVPMGYVPNFNPQGGGDIDDSSGDYSSGSSGTMWLEGKMSAKCLRFLKGCEGFAPRLYSDSGGVPTIGYGVTSGAGSVYNELVSNQPVSEEMAAKKMYETAVANYGKPIVETCKKLGVTKQCQFDALFSLAYNCGTGVVTSSNTLMNTIANGIDNKEAIMNAWKGFRVKDKSGTTLKGLIWRREQEAKMFFGEEFEIRAIAILGGGTVDGDGWLPEDYTDETGEIDGYKNVSNDYGSDWLVPVKGASLTSPYGWRIHPTLGTKQFHSGVDLACPTGTPILATKTGEIVQTGTNSTMGNFIRHNIGEYQVIYMHLSKIIASQGETVNRGTIIGEVGSTGRSTGPHLHWQIQTVDGGTTTNPMPNNKKGDTV